MLRRLRLTHSETFKAHVTVAARRGDKPVAEFADKFEIYPNQIAAWKVQHLVRTNGPFGEKGAGTLNPNIENIEAKIGRLTLENDFLESTLVKAGLLNAKR